MCVVDLHVDVKAMSRFNISIYMFAVSGTALSCLKILLIATFCITLKEPLGAANTYNSLGYTQVYNCVNISGQ